MRIATAAYPLSAFEDWDGYAVKQADWVAEAASNGAELLVFPEYARMELAMLDGPGSAADLKASVQAVDAWTGAANELMANLARRRGVHILAGSGPVLVGGSAPVNRAALFGPHGPIGVQDKQIMTRFEREVWGIAPGDPLAVFETALGRIGILICYDAEFPLLGRALSDLGAEILLVPSCTDALAGYTRVRVGAMARALENQCIAVQSSTILPVPWSPAVDENTGAAAVFGPPDLGFPPTGILAEGALNTPGWTYTDIDLRAVARVRREGQVFNHAHWPESAIRAAQIDKHTDLP